MSRLTNDKKPGGELESAALQTKPPKPLTLSVIDGVLCLYDCNQVKAKVFVDFLSGKLAFRTRRHLQGENLIKACRIKNQTTVSILDATCGLGKDAFLLYSAGFQVTATEQNAVVYQLLKDGLRRFFQAKDHTPFQLLHTQAVQQMNKQAFDVIYLDPMFPPKNKSALVKKDMQLFQQLHRHQHFDNQTLFLEAMQSAKIKVVVKRPKNAEFITEKTPTYQIFGKNYRFDIYLSKNSSYYFTKTQRF